MKTPMTSPIRWVLLIRYSGLDFSLPADDQRPVRCSMYHFFTTALPYESILTKGGPMSGGRLQDPFISLPVFTFTVMSFFFIWPGPDFLQYYHLRWHAIYGMSELYALVQFNVLPIHALSRAHIVVFKLILLLHLWCVETQGVTHSSDINPTMRGRKRKTAKIMKAVENVVLRSSIDAQPRTPQATEKLVENLVE